jgi:hypothetical protein
MRAARVLLAAALLSLPWLVAAQPTPQPPGATAGTGAATAGKEAGATGTTAPSAGTPSADEAAPPPPTAEGLTTSTTARDIDTASYYELVAWCDRLKLDDAGSRRDLQVRLAQYYKVTLPTAAPAANQTVTVKSAREAEYFTGTEMKEKYVLLRGDVVLEVRNTTDGTVQVIKAGSITYNQTKRTVSAQGDVSYSLTRGSQTDTFTGQSLAFNLDSSEAVFYDGKTARTVKQAGNDIPYTFQGETITRHANDTVIMQNGSFTSSDTPIDPFYQVQAGSVWILGPGEWAVQNALLMIGRVPILYLPGFFWPGDEFFFNPNLGYDSREGSFIQTTTYLVGRKPKQDSPFSFLQISESGDAGYDLQPNGLFLRKVPTSTPRTDKGQTLKLMADVYSRLGFFVGLAGDFSPLATFKTGIGVSRTVFTDANTGVYTPFLPFFATGYTFGQEFWNSSSLFGLDVPFRFGLEGTLKSSMNFYSINADFQYFSDPSFTTDFYSRNEAGILSTVLTPLNPTGAATTQQANLSWDYASRLDLTKAIGGPLVQSFALPNLDMKFTWQSRQAPYATNDPRASDPGSTFYIPASLTVPSVSLSVSGNILQLSTNPAQPATPASTAPATPAAPGGTPTAKPPSGGTNAAPGPAAAVPPGSAPAAAAPSGSTAPVSGNAPPAQAPAGGKAPVMAPDPGKGFRIPVPEKPKAPEAAKPPRLPFRSPSAQPDVSGGIHLPVSSFTLSYQVQPRATLEHTFDTRLNVPDAWVYKENVDYSVLYRTFETAGSTSLTAAASILDDLADLSATFGADGLWRTRFDPKASYSALPDWQGLLLSDELQDRVAFRTALQTAVHPFIEIPSLAASSLQYRLGLRLDQFSYSGTVSPTLGWTGVSWTPDSVSEHSLQSNLAFSIPSTSDSLALAVQLPPLAPTLTGVLSLSAGLFSGRIQGGVATPQVSGVTQPPQYQPFVVSATVGAGQKINATEEVQVDILSSTLSKSTSQIAVGGFTGTFIAQSMLPVDAYGNLTGSVQKLLPSTVQVGYEAATDSLWFWKNRIKTDLSLKTHWYMNLQKYTDNLFDFSLNLNFSIYKYLDLTFSSVSNNSRTFLYFPELAAQLGSPWVNPLQDLLWGFDFFDTRPAALNNRNRSAFKINTLAVKIVQHLHDWDLTFQYQGSPLLITTNGPPHYEWSPVLAIQVQWNAVPQIKSNIHSDYTGVTLR